MKNKILKFISVLIILIVIVATIVFVLHLNKQTLDKESNVNNENVNIVTSLEDKIGENAAWCGTFNLIWNDLKNDIAKQDIKFNEESEIVNNLNKGTFTTVDISEDSYYKTYGTPSLELKAKIEKAIKEKFNETSAILNSFEWENHGEDSYFLYAMLKKDFEYPKTFDELSKGTFEKYDNVKYFGIDNKTKDQVRRQVEVLYYNSEDDFAFKVKTKGNDEIIVAVGREENTFLDIYNSIIEYSNKFTGNKSLSEADTLKMPYISFNLNKTISEVMNKPFVFSDGTLYEITQALQTIEFELDEKGGRIKSEAGMMVDNAMMMPEESRKFNVDQSFVMFLIESDKDLPYFATKISDISAVQSGVTLNNKNEVVENNNVKIQDVIYSNNNEKLSLELPENWKYEYISEPTEMYQYGIRLYPENSEKSVAIYSYNSFGVCGTDLHCEDDVSDDGTNLVIGYYGKDEPWSFISYEYKDKEIAAVNNGVEAEEAKEAIEILKTVKYEENTVQSFVATILEEQIPYLIVKPNEDEIESKSADKIQVSLGVTERDYVYGIGRKIRITYDGDIMETYPARINAIAIEVVGE